MDGELSGERAAQNQSLYRSINENIKDLNQVLAEVAVERIVAENDRFITVEKLDNGGQLAETLDPRHTDDA